MKTTIIILAIVAIVAGVGAVTSLISIHQVNAQVVPDLGRGLPSAGFPPNPSADPVCAVFC
ncbi:MAG TPA: hypothetical protein VEL11_08905 [Candidatus Bathyarchaeia archaeon]|nr:hypothetical protein [Candidatus Bathyarchaeia archaeon]